jgi:hypothetical protein
MSEKIVLSKVSKPSWPPPRGSVEVSQTATSLERKVGGISHAPRRIVKDAVWEQPFPRLDVLYDVTVIVSSLDPVVPVKV